MNPVENIHMSNWNSGLTPETAARALDALESGSVLRLQLPFPLLDQESDLLSPGLLSGARKNISYNSDDGSLKGCVNDPQLELCVRGLLERYNSLTRQLADTLFVPYRGHLQVGRTSYRPAEIAGRKSSSWRRDDTRLHIDAFPATPVSGRRLLRFFHNLNPHDSRRWIVGEPFPELARHFFSLMPKPSVLQARLLAFMQVTRSLRSSYDHYMLQLHDRMKADLDYQAKVPKIPVEFAPGETWIVYSDQASHAVLSGRFMLEQTFYLPVDNMAYPERSPLRVLEGLAGHTLV